MIISEDRQEAPFHSFIVSVTQEASFNNPRNTLMVRHLCLLFPPSIALVSYSHRRPPTPNSFNQLPA